MLAGSSTGAQGHELSTGHPSRRSTGAPVPKRRSRRRNLKRRLQGARLGLERAVAKLHKTARCRAGFPDARSRLGRWFSDAGQQAVVTHVHESATASAELCAVNRTGSSGHQSEDEPPGKDLWRVLVLAVLKQGLGCDYDCFQELANRRQTVREMLGHSVEIYAEWTSHYQLQTLIDNVSLLRPQLPTIRF